jgi:hypothetical protein
LNYQIVILTLEEIREKLSWSSSRQKGDGTRPLVPREEKGEEARPLGPWAEKGEGARPLEEKGEAGREPEMKEESERSDPHRLPGNQATTTF